MFVLCIILLFQLPSQPGIKLYKGSSKKRICGVSAWGAQALNIYLGFPAQQKKASQLLLLTKFSKMIHA